MNVKEIISYIKENCNHYKTRGLEMIIECPWCGDKREHCHFNPHKIKNNEIGFGVCFSCSKEFSFTMLVASVEGLSYGKAKEVLKRREFKGLTIEKLKKVIRNFLNRKKIKKLKIGSASSIDVPEECMKFEKEINEYNGRFLKYLYSRGYSFEELKQWSFSFCNSGYYKDRIIMPVYCNGNKSFVARTIHNEKWYKNIGEKYRKYINPKGSKHSLLLYNYDNLMIKRYVIKCVVINEGVTDVHNLSRFGLDAVCTFGKKLSDEQIMLLVKLGINKVALMFDNNPKDFKESINLRNAKDKAISKLSEFFEVIEINCPEEKDPGIMTKEEIRFCFRKLYVNKFYSILKKIKTF